MLSAGASRLLHPLLHRRDSLRTTDANEVVS